MLKRRVRAIPAAQFSSQLQLAITVVHDMKKALNKVHKIAVEEHGGYNDLFKSPEKLVESVVGTK